MTPRERAEALRTELAIGHCRPEMALDIITAHFEAAMRDATMVTDIITRREWPIHLTTVDREALGPERTEQLTRVIRALEEELAAAKAEAEKADLQRNDIAAERDELQQMVDDRNKEIGDCDREYASTCEILGLVIGKEGVEDAARRVVRERDEAIAEVERVKAFAARQEGRCIQHRARLGDLARRLRKLADGFHFAGDLPAEKTLRHWIETEFSPANDSLDTHTKEKP